MLTNLLEITLDPLLGPSYLNKKNKEQAHADTCFSLIYSDYQNINLRSSYSKLNLYPIPELSQFISKKEKEKIMSNRIHTFNAHFRQKFEKKHTMPLTALFADEPKTVYRA